MYRYVTVLCLLAASVAALATVACNGPSDAYTGTWSCSGRGRTVLDVKRNGKAFLVTDETGVAFPATLDDSGTLVLSSVPMMGTMALPIDEQSGELICNACDCHRLHKQQAVKEEASAGSDVPRGRVTFSAGVQVNIDIGTDQGVKKGDVYCFYCEGCQTHGGCARVRDVGLARDTTMLELIEGRLPRAGDAAIRR